MVPTRHIATKTMPEPIRKSLAEGEQENNGRLSRPHRTPPRAAQERGASSTTKAVGKAKYTGWCPSKRTTRDGALANAPAESTQTKRSTLTSLPSRRPAHRLRPVAVRRERVYAVTGGATRFHNPFTNVGK